MLTGPALIRIETPRLPFTIPFDMTAHSATHDPSKGTPLMKVEGGLTSLKDFEDNA